VGRIWHSYRHSQKSVDQSKLMADHAIGNPRFATAIKAVAVIAENDLTFLLAVGGGSVIDATKFIAAAAKYDGDAWDILTSMGGVVTSAMPFGIRANLMWTATLALDGLIGAGVPHDWASHMIGHEITALNDTDHARTLAVVLPALMQDQRGPKREKLLQYAANVWNIREGDDDARIDAVIEATRTFFHTMRFPLSEHYVR
jgi:alcohol dehydrogenase YqhD (iron-dependent ADH family)